MGRRRPGFWLQSGGIGVSIGASVAAVMSYLDWRLNPGRVFHDEAGTHWDIVAATALSWFVPVAALGFAAAAIALALLRKT